MLHPVSGPALGTLPPRVITLGEAMARGVRQTAQHWVTGWAAGQVAGAPVPGMAATVAAGVRDCTVRNAVFLSAGGGSVRVRLSNAFGDRPVAVDHATVAVRSQGADAVPGTMRALTFSGSARTVLAAGGTLLSDPVALAVAPLSTLLVSVFVPGATGPLTHHPFTAATNYLADGDAAPSTFGGAFRSSPCWLLVSAVEVLADARTSGTVVAFGDSITDTASTTGDLNRRYPDQLARRLAAREGRTLSVVNAGLGGNCLLGERTGEPHYGPSGLSRMERDIFAHSGVRAVILLEGINDIGCGASAADLIAGYRAFAERVLDRGAAVWGGTLLPFRGSAIWNGERAAVWQTVNDWIRTSGAFDGVVDFAAATASPDDPLTLHPAYDSGDRLHPNDAGTRAMADAVDLDALLSRGAAG